MNTDVIRYIKPVLPKPEEWAPYLRESYESGYFANFGPAVRRFETRLREKYARTRAVITGPNATNSLVAALQALNISGKVLTPSYTFPATIHAILMAGCTPLFCDISDETWELDPAALEMALADPEIGAILHVRAYGFGHDLAWLERAAKRREVPLIVDAAAAIGGEQSSVGHVGQQGDVEVFSFHATKVFGMGEGSASFARPDLDGAFRLASNFGIRYPDVVGAGQNSKLSDFQAAVGLAMLDRIDGYIAQRRRVAERYHATLGKLPSIRQAPNPNLAPWQSYPVRLAPGHDAGMVLERALAAGLELKRGYYKPLHQSTRFHPFAHGSLAVSEDISTQVICLPVYSDMPIGLADRVLEIFQNSLAA